MASTMTDKILALAGTELKLVFRNRTVAVSSVLVPIALGLFWAFSLGGSDPRGWTLVIALQLAVTLGMGIYVTATQTVVARRHNLVLKRMRTSGISDTGLLGATVAPSVVLGIGQLVIFAVINAVFGAPLPSSPVPLVLALLAGLALMVAAALATTVVTPSPERAQVTTLPLVFVVLGAAVALLMLPLEGWWQALVALPGAGIGQLVRLAFAPGGEAGGLLPTLLAAFTVLAWAVLFGWFARRRFRWDPRS
ncbi:ABC transporter permease [Pseudonocardia asaccharolytica]|uniref:Transport permease protein n=1 Tax=Pseudonocardia asaccharolytica DSM 44247 = NBRC 16224 TaxID=1123024 RepID=A0A511D5D6_9PSEU|nr:ABC transporter permease [Pseudonocardia asaccharolytica]GEL20006.1 transport permease protein [Pseudonocardia asaccharolytica DSM 44247 = NBRC 16224]